MRKIKRLVVANIKRSMIPFLKFGNRILRYLSKLGHHAQHYAEWSGGPSPEWYDHYLDQYYGWNTNKNSFWLERGVFCNLALKNGRTLELCCGDGFNTLHFYSSKSKSIHALDIDPTAIEHARRNNQTQNINYFVGDIRNDLPHGNFDNIIWDAAIAHFTPEDSKKIMTQIADKLGETGIFSGCTVVDNKTGLKQLSHHIYEFQDKQDLANFLSPWFKNVTVFETQHPGRNSLYFFASNDIIPFSHNWPNMLTIRT